MLYKIGFVMAMATVSSASQQAGATNSTNAPSSISTLRTIASCASTLASSALYCATTTVYASTETFTERFDTTTCTAYSTTTKVPTTTLYTGNFSAPSLSTETLLSYGDLYTSGELASTPTCAPANCSGTSTTTLSGTQSTMVTSGTSTISTICPTTAYQGSTVSTTQDLRCAPTNLISTVQGNGIYRPTPVAGSSTHYNFTTVDAGDCCQRCVDTADCAAGYSELNSLGKVETCALIIISPDTVLALNYSDSAAFEYSKLDPDGNGAYRVSYGCGSVQPAVYEDNCLPAS
ncbi:hypothetical protein LTR85_004848 [Meristemomyces frigidus]|nr:hypothetical protein LTR85_004848 [Meristemomyces frigidus]